ncbi:MAG: hypothetical protein M3R14_11410 [Acidobacteriota bacterium]|nr:hypothetical protein [Acidobacteriota bacterium]
MKIDALKLQQALLSAQTALKNQDLPSFLQRRWSRALEKAKDRLIEQPIFSWQPDRLVIVSVPKEQEMEKKGEIGCRFYEAHRDKCRRIDKTGFCQAFFEGFPCWHRAAFLLLGIYFGERAEIKRSENRKHNYAANGVNQS